MAVASHKAWCLRVVHWNGGALGTCTSRRFTDKGCCGCMVVVVIIRRRGRPKEAGTRQWLLLHMVCVEGSNDACCFMTKRTSENVKCFPFIAIHRQSRQSKSRSSRSHPLSFLIVFESLSHPLSFHIVFESLSHPLSFVTFYYCICY